MIFPKPVDYGYKSSWMVFSLDAVAVEKKGQDDHQDDNDSHTEDCVQGGGHGHVHDGVPSSMCRVGLVCERRQQ